MADEVFNKYFKDTQSCISGMNFEHLAKEEYKCHYLSYSYNTVIILVLINLGYFHWYEVGENTLMTILA